MAVSKYLDNQIKERPEDSHRIRRFIVLAGRQPFRLRVTDDSMAPRFPKGTEIIVQPYNNEHGLVVAMAAGEILFRALEVGPSGMWLVAANSSYEPIEVDETVHLLGAVISTHYVF